jgi:hypothetical protein
VGKRWDSNPRDIVPQTSAKPLSYSHLIEIKKKTRLFSTSQQKVTFVHWTPINVLVWNVFEIDFGTSFSLEMLSVILSANVAAELYSLRNNSLTRDSAQAILSYTLGLPQSPLGVDKSHTVSRRIEPNSCTTLQDEQSYPFNRLQLKDVISRHRGVKPIRRCELLGLINLLSPAYL